MRSAGVIAPELARSAAGRVMPRACATRGARARGTGSALREGAETRAAQRPGSGCKQQGRAGHGRGARGRRGGPLAGARGACECESGGRAPRARVHALSRRARAATRARSDRGPWARATPRGASLAARNEVGAARPSWRASMLWRAPSEAPRAARAAREMVRAVDAPNVSIERDPQAASGRRSQPCPRSCSGARGRTRRATSALGSQHAVRGESQCASRWTPAPLRCRARRFEGSAARARGRGADWRRSAGVGVRNAAARGVRGAWSVRGARPPPARIDHESPRFRQRPRGPLKSIATVNGQYRASHSTFSSRLDTLPTPLPKYTGRTRLSG